MQHLGRRQIGRPQVFIRQHRRRIAFPPLQLQQCIGIVQPYQHRARRCRERIQKRPIPLLDLTGRKSRRRSAVIPYHQRAPLALLQDPCGRCLSIQHLYRRIKPHVAHHIPAFTRTQGKVAHRIDRIGQRQRMFPVVQQGYRPFHHIQTKRRIPLGAPSRPQGKRVHPGRHSLQDPRRAFGSQDAPHTLLDPLPADPSPLDRGKYRPVSRLRIFGIQQQVVSGQDRFDLGFPATVAAGHAPHVEGIGDHQALIVPRPAEDSPDDALGKTRGTLTHTVEGRHVEMSGHYTRHPAPAGFFKGTQFDLLQTAGRKRQHRQFLVAVGTGGPVSREMLDRSQHPRILHPPDKGCDLARHPMRIFPEGTHPDDRVFRLRIHIGRRGEIGIDSHLSAGLPDAPTHLIHQRIVPECSHGQRPGIPEGTVQTHGQPALQRHGGQKRHPPAVLLRLRKEIQHRLGFVAIQRHSAHTAAIDQVQRSGDLRRGLEKYRRDEHLPYFFLQAHRPTKRVHPLAIRCGQSLVSKTAGRLSQKPDTPDQNGQEQPQTVFHSDDKILFAFPRAPFLHGARISFPSPFDLSPIRSPPYLSFSLLSSVSPPRIFSDCLSPGSTAPG